MINSYFQYLQEIEDILDENPDKNEDNLSDSKHRKDYDVSISDAMNEPNTFGNERGVPTPEEINLGNPISGSKNNDKLVQCQLPSPKGEGLID